MDDISYTHRVNGLLVVFNPYNLVEDLLHVEDDILSPLKSVRFDIEVCFFQLDRVVVELDAERYLVLRLNVSRKLLKVFLTLFKPRLRSEVSLVI